MSHYEERAFMNEEMARDIDDPLQDAAAEIETLKAELKEAREIIRESLEIFDMLTNELVPEMAEFFDFMGQSDHANRIRAAMAPNNDDLPARARAFLKEKADG